MSAADVLAPLQPVGIWRRFAELTEIPRPPKEEEHARGYVLGWARKLGVDSAVDDEGNVVIRVPASAGRESAPTVVLQAHLDMVCEREPGSSFDPRTGSINVVVDGDWVVAEETTLGADNGIGVAAAMAVAEDPGIEHGPLELLFTVSEEQGLDGAKALDPAFVSGRLLVNLDGTSDTSLTIGCAGSTHTFTRLPLELEPMPDGHLALAVALSGACGGHSGGDIARGRVNAIKALGRVLGRAPLRLACLEGGVSRNALPREARAVVAIARADETAFRAAAERVLSALREQHAGTDDALSLSIEEIDAEEMANETTSARALALLAALPSGVVAMNVALPGTAETSTSVNVALTTDGELTLASMTRSANAAALENVVAGIESAAYLAGADVDVQPSYPPWRPDLDSQLLAVARSTFERVFGISPVLEVVHGGLECAVIGERLPGIEMISLGPEIVGPHAPGERVGISSTQRFYRLLGGLIDDLSRRPVS